MSKGLGVRPAERVDLEDFLHGSFTFPKGEVGIAAARQLLDNQSRVLNGFRVEIPDQTVYPGRIVIHGGYALDRSGQRLFNEDYLTVSRTTTLEGAATTFWVEVEYVEVDSESDARAFWDPTVAQAPEPSGDPSPAGQEFGDTVATRKSMDWRIVYPIRTGTTAGFTRDSDPTSLKVPVVKLSTDATGKITGVTTEKAATVILEVLSTTPGKLRVQDAQHFLVGDVVVSDGRTFDGDGDTLAAAAGVVTLTDNGYTFSSLFVGQSITIAGATTSGHNGTFVITATGTHTVQYNNPAGGLPASETFNGTWSIAAEETKTIASTDVDGGVITLTGNIKAYHTTADIVRGDGSSAPNFLSESKVNRYSRSLVPGPDYRDRMFQGDEIHGRALLQGTDSWTGRSDLSLKSIKDYVDYLSAQVAEMKWGWCNPWEGGDSKYRMPPGLKTAFPANPRHFDRAGGIQGARIASVTVGDGITSWGDFVGSSQDTLNAAINSLPAGGGTVFVKDGNYYLATDWDITKPVSMVFSPNSKIYCEGGCIHVAVSGADYIGIRGLRMFMGLSTPSNIGIKVDTASPWSFEMFDSALNNVSFDWHVAMPLLASIRMCFFGADDASMAAIPLIRTVGTAAQISGIWSECNFIHGTGFGINGACLNASSSSVGFYFASFLNCNFLSAGLCWESVYLGTNPNTVSMDTCTFASGATLAHITVIGGSNLKFRNCVGVDAVAAFCNAANATAVQIEGYVNQSSVGFATIYFTNCTNVKVKSCIVKGNSLNSLSTAPMRFSCSTGVLDDIMLEGNTIECTTDLGCGVIFDLNGGSEIRNVSIVGNNFGKCECGLFFANTGTAAVYSDINISGNSFIDRDTLLGVVSDYQKVGIYAQGTSNKYRWSITGNNFTNFNPLNNTAVGVVTRNAVCIGGSFNYEFIFKSNRVLNVGNPLFPMSNTSAFRMVNAYNSVFEGNTVVGVYGTYAHGILSDNTFTECVISNNVINTIQGTSVSLLAAGGVTALKFLKSSIVSNTFKDVKNIGGGISGGIIVADTVAGEVDTCAISNNTSCGTDSTYSRLNFGICLYINRLSWTTITGNTVSGYSAGNILVIGTTGGYIEETSISNNASRDCNGLLGTGACIWVNGSGAALRSLAINNNVSTAAIAGIWLTGSYFGATLNNNSITTTDNVSAISVYQCQQFTINGNFCYRGSGNGSTIKVDTGNAFVISGNRCLEGDTSGYSIDTFSSGATKGLVIGNTVHAITHDGGSVTTDHNLVD